MKGSVLSWSIPVGDGRACCGRTTFCAHDTECEARFSTPVRKPLLVALRALALLGLVGFAASEADGVVTKVDLKIELLGGLMIIFGPATAQ